MKKIQFPVKQIGFAFLVLASLALTAFAASLNNPYWGAPMIALIVMFLIGNLREDNEHSWFYWFYLGLVVLAGYVLTSPLGVDHRWTFIIIFGTVVQLFI